MKKIELACIIEDDPIHLFITKKYMEIPNLVKEVIVYENGKDAFEGLKSKFHNGEKLPQIIFLDLNMPVWNGWQFLKEFTKLSTDQEITIYILSSSNSEEDLERAKQYEKIKNYYIKPIELSQMKEILLQHVTAINLA